MPPKGKRANLYHGALAAMGQVMVTVQSEPTPSKFRKPDLPNMYVNLLIQGTAYSYTCENMECANFFRGQNGQNLMIMASGQRDQATIQYLGQPASQMQQPDNPPPPRNNQPRNNPPPPPGGATAPPQTQTPPQQNTRRQTNQPPPPATMSPEHAVGHAKVFIGRNRSLIAIAMKALIYHMEDFQNATGVPMSQEMACETLKCLLYGSGNEPFFKHLPVNVTISEQEPPPQQQ